MDDVRTVMDAVGSERAALVGHGHAGQLCMLVAASHPGRISEARDYWHLEGHRPPPTWER